MKALRVRYSLRTIILTLNLIVLAIPLLGIGSLRILENFLHRQTEAKLISEGTYVRSLFLSTLKDLIATGDAAEVPVRAVQSATRAKDALFDPIFAEIDVSRQPVLPAPEDAKPPVSPPPAILLEAGKRISSVLTEAQRQNLSAVRVLDLSGVVVATTGSELGLDISHRQEVTRALSGQYHAVLRERPSGSANKGMFGRSSRVRVFVALPILNDQGLVGVVTLNRTSLSLFRDVWERRYTLALLLMLGLALAIGLGCSTLISRPLRQLVQKAKDIATGHTQISLEVQRTAPREAHELATALSAMVGTLQNRMEYTMEFTKNVSHELKTPLTSMRGSVELLRDNWEEMEKNDRVRFLTIIEKDVQRMDRLVRRLLELSRLDAKAPSSSTTDLRPLLTSLVHHYREAGHPVTFSGCTESMSIPMDEELAETLFVNLVENAVVHGKGASVTVALDQGPVVRVTDQGPGISEANLPKIFDRFFTTARADGGTGLGLPIVKSILKSQGGKIDVTSGPTGTVFTVDFRTD